MNAVVLLVTRDTDLRQRLGESCHSHSLTIDYLERLAEANRRLKKQGAVQALAIDLSTLHEREFEALRALALARVWANFNRNKRLSASVAGPRQSYSFSRICL